MAINEAAAPGDMIVLEGEATNTTMVGTDILVVGGDFNVMIQQIVVGLDLSCLGIEFSACSKVSFFLFRESLGQVEPVTV